MTCSGRRTATAVLLVCCFAFAQTANKLEFEVATIRPADPARNGLGMNGISRPTDSGQITYNNLSLQELIVIAFKLHPYQVVATQPLSETRFDITAKVPPGATPDATRTMLQNLLIERWRLQSHREQRQMSVYTLMIGKNGIKMKPSIAAPESVPDNDSMRIGASGCPELPGRRLPSSLFIALGAYCVTGTHQTIAGLAEMLSAQFDRPVLDLTESQTEYDFSMRFSPAGLRPSTAPPAFVQSADSDTSGAPDINSEMQRLGLRMESRKAPVDVLVIEHAERMPAQN